MGELVQILTGSLNQMDILRGCLCSLQQVEECDEMDESGRSGLVYRVAVWDRSHFSRRMDRDPSDQRMMIDSMNDLFLIVFGICTKCM